MTEGGNNRRVNVPSLYGKARRLSRRNNDGRNFSKNGDRVDPINSELRGYGVRETSKVYVMPTCHCTLRRTLCQTRYGSRFSLKEQVNGQEQ